MADNGNDDGAPDGAKGITQLPEKARAFIEETNEFSVKDFHRFLENTAWNDFRCEVCDNDRFQIGVMDELVFPYRLVAIASSNLGTRVMYVHCSECGNAKLLDVGAVVRWLEANGHED